MALDEIRSSKYLVRVDPKRQYRLLRTILFEEPQGFQYEPGKHGGYDFWLCPNWEVELFGPDETSKALARLARVAVDITRFFTFLRYPKHVWEPILAGFELQQLESIIESGDLKGDLVYPFTDSLFRRAEAYRTTQDRSFPKITSVKLSLGCGDTYATVKVVIRPPGGRIRYWPALYYVFYQRQGLKASDTRECDQWNEASDGEEVVVGGAYWYQATWPKGPLGNWKKGFWT
jgi:hypothetical protein